MKLLPYKQGYLDSLCGIYSIVNATRLIMRNMREEEAEKLFIKCMRHVAKRKSMGKVTTDGITATDLWNILQKCVLTNYSINIERPFHRNGNISTKDYLRELREYLEAGGKRSVIISVQCGVWWDHWTVIRSITAKQISFFDSAMMKRINTARCIVNKLNKNKPYLFTPEMTFFLSEK